MDSCGEETVNWRLGEHPMRTDKRELLNEFCAEARKRELQGMQTYGPFDSETDTRTLSVEAQEEAIDSYVYMKFFQRKYPDYYEHNLEVRRLAFSLYCELRKLEELEMRLTTKNGGTP
jgi:hypothetical protein